MIAVYPSRRLRKPHACRTEQKYPWAEIIGYNPKVSMYAIFEDADTFEKYRRRVGNVVLAHGTIIWKKRPRS